MSSQGFWARGFLKYFSLTWLDTLLVAKKNTDTGYAGLCKRVNSGNGDYLQ